MEIIKQLYENREYDKIINYKNQLKRLTYEDHYYLGLTYLKLDYPNNALRHLNKIKQKYIQSNNIYEKMYRYLGIAEYMLGNYKKSEYYFKTSFLQSKRELKLNKNWLILLGLHKDYLPIIVRETENMIYRFMDNFSRKEIKKFIDSYELSYKRINKLFNVLLRKKIDVYVYKSNMDQLGSTLCYANAPMAMIHTNHNVIGGHEIAHIILHYIHENMIKTRFIDEGFATYLDKETMETFVEIKEIFNRKSINILEYWNNYDKYIQREANLVGGAFIKYIIKEYGLDKLIMFLKDQRISNAYNVFGENINVVF